ncbi:MAG TPA: adenylate/guanylate cyclase domain-containing protein, partial [Chloroflexota bacterium]
YTTAAASLYALAQVALPLAIATAIFRQGLLDIDFLLNRAFVYTILTVVLVAAFVLISTVANSAVTAATGKTVGVVPLVTAVGLAVLFLPLRSALLRFADRFMSGRRVLTVVFLDIVQSTEHAVRLGDRGWRALVENFQRTVRKELKRFGGDEIDTAGDGFLVTFPGPGRAIQFSCEVVRAVRTLELHARAGVHVGEVEVHGSRVFGVAVHIAARLIGLAAPDEVLVSSDLKALIAGSNYNLVDRGEHYLKGVPRSARVFAVA